MAKSAYDKSKSDIVQVHIDRKPYESVNPTIGKALYRLGHVPQGKLVVRWFEAPSAWKPLGADAVALQMKINEKALYDLYSCSA